MVVGRVAELIRKLVGFDLGSSKWQWDFGFCYFAVPSRMSDLIRPRIRAFPLQEVLTNGTQPKYRLYYYTAILSVADTDFMTENLKKKI